jgi:hypothetical protein
MHAVEQLDPPPAPRGVGEVLDEGVDLIELVDRGLKPAIGEAKMTVMKDKRGRFMVDSLSGRPLAQTRVPPSVGAFDPADRPPSFFPAEGPWPCAHEGDSRRARLYDPRMTSIGDDLLPSRLDDLLSAIDVCVAAQLDEIVYHPLFQQMERAWRGLWVLVERTDFAENIRIALLPCTKEELRADLATPAGVEVSALYGVVYTAELGRVGGEPSGAILADIEIGAAPADVLFLARASKVAEAALAPFIVAAGPRFFGLELSYGWG